MTLQSITLFASRTTLTNCRLKKQNLIRCVLSVCWFWRFMPNKPELRQYMRCFSVRVIKEILPLLSSDFSIWVLPLIATEGFHFPTTSLEAPSTLLFHYMVIVPRHQSVLGNFFWQEEQMISKRFHKINGRAKIVRVKAKRNATFIRYNNLE